MAGSPGQPSVQDAATQTSDASDGDERAARRLARARRQNRRHARLAHPASGGALEGAISISPRARTPERRPARLGAAAAAYDGPLVGSRPAAGACGGLGAAAGGMPLGACPLDTDASLDSEVCFPADSGANAAALEAKACGGNEHGRHAAQQGLHSNSKAGGATGVAFAGSCGGRRAGAGAAAGLFRQPGRAHRARTQSAPEAHELEGVVPRDPPARPGEPQRSAYMLAEDAPPGDVLRSGPSHPPQAPDCSGAQAGHLAWWGRDASAGGALPSTAAQPPSLNGSSASMYAGCLPGAVRDSPTYIPAASNGHEAQGATTTAGGASVHAATAQAGCSEQALQRSDLARLSAAAKGDDAVYAMGSVEEEEGEDEGDDSSGLEAASQLRQSSDDIGGEDASQGAAVEGAARLLQHGAAELDLLGASSGTSHLTSPSASPRSVRPQPCLDAQLM